MSQLDNQELKYWVAFNQVSSIGPKRFSQLLNYFPSITEAWQASSSELKSAGLPEKVIAELIEARSEIEPEHEMEKVVKQELNIVTIQDDDYPTRLKEIPNPPPLLYYRGQPFSTQDELSLAVVGTRKISPYGRQVTEDIVTGLTNQGLVIVSGLALGIDATAHQACLQADGRTVAVLGNGLDAIYPTTNENLARSIVERGGTIISEFPIGTPSYKSNFPHRNRIISGLSLGTLVIEAGASSGSLITAKIALEQNRDVFAVPGPIYAPGAVGSNQLISQGACLVGSAEDIINELSLRDAPEIIESREILPDNELEAKVIKVLTLEPAHIDDIIAKAKLDVQEINSILVTMELKGKVKDLGGQTYALAR